MNPHSSLLFITYPLELRCFVLDYQHHDWYTFIVPLRFGAFHIFSGAFGTSNLPPEHWRSSGDGLGIPCGCPCVKRVFRSVPNSALSTVFTMAVGLAMAGLKLDSLPVLLSMLTSFQRSVVPTRLAVVRTSGQLCFQPPRGRPLLHGSVGGSTYLVRLL
jgi:hypothetical protein